MIRILNWLSLLMFCLAGVMTYAYVYDVEPLTQEKYYEMERSAYGREHHYDYESFPNFNEWVRDQEAREARFHDYVHSLYEKFGDGCAASFDLTYNDARYEAMSAREFIRERGRD